MSIIVISTIRTQDYEKKEGVGLWKKNVIFFKLGAFMYLGEEKCVEDFPEAPIIIKFIYVK